MSEKICLIKQPAGFGDILFLYKIAAKIIQQNKATKVIWPVVPEYSYLQQYIGTDKINFVPITSDFPHKNLYSRYQEIYNDKEVLFLPFQNADSLIPSNPETSNHPMYVKYELVAEEYRDWKSYIHLNRNTKREQKIKNYFLKNDTTDYILVNRMYGTPPDCTRGYVPEFANEIEINAFQVEGSRIFDWLLLAEHAKEIHTVETGLCYLFDILNLQNVTIYPKRVTDNIMTDFGYIKNIYNTNWKYYNEKS